MMNQEVRRFRDCMSQMLHWTRQYDAFERICEYSELLDSLERSPYVETREIAAVALAHFCTYGLYYDTALAGIMEFLGITPGQNGDGLIVEILAAGVAGPREFYEILKQH